MSRYSSPSTWDQSPPTQSRDSIQNDPVSPSLHDAVYNHINDQSQGLELEFLLAPPTTGVAHTIQRKPLPISPGTPNFVPTAMSDIAPEDAINSSNEARDPLPGQDESGVGSYESKESHLNRLNSTEMPLKKPERNDENEKEPKTKPTLVHRFWIWEIAASLLSLACMASIIGVLAYEDGRRLDEWGLGQRFFAPNVVVSLLGTVGKSASLLVLTEIISQLKWLHFQNSPHKLSDLQLFDSASRGPWGAFRLASIKNMKAVLESCASILVVASLLVDPFLQSVFQLPVRLAPLAGVTPGISESRVYDPASLRARFGQCYSAANVESQMQAAILAPIWNATRSPSLPCNFERCEWPDVITLGVCSNCEDLKKTVAPTCDFNNDLFRAVDCNYTVPSVGVSFNAVFGMTGGASVQTRYSTVWNSVADDEWQKTLDDAWNSKLQPSFTKSRRALISKFSFVSFSPEIEFNGYHAGRTAPPVAQAMQCSLELCARTFKAPFYANFSASPLAGPQTPLVTTLNGTSDGNTGIAYVGLEPAGSDQQPTSTRFKINYCEYKDIGLYLKDLFTTTMSTTGVVGTTSDTSTSGATQIRQRLTPGLGLAFSQTDDISALMQGIADSMTEVFRTSANSTVLNGVAKTSVTYITIAWPRLVLPIFLIVLTFVILLVVISRNHRRGMPTWKSSSLALLFHEMYGWDGTESRATGPEDVDRRARDMDARFLNEGRLRFYKAK